MRKVHLLILFFIIENGNDKIFPSTNPLIAKESSNKKRHRRLKSYSSKNSDSNDASDGFEFVIVSLDNKQWHFEATNCDEREAWVLAIEQQILSSLQELESDKSKYRIVGVTDKAAGQAIRAVKGNSQCVDCDAPSMQIKTPYGRTFSHFYFSKFRSRLGKFEFGCSYLHRVFRYPS